MKRFISKLAKVAAISCIFAIGFGSVVSCDNGSGDDAVEKTNNSQSATPTIYLAGDSTVMTYNESWFIGGWGQFLSLFVKDNITVKNAAKGGRSSRSFINEGRLFNHKSGDNAVTNYNYNFSENEGKSIEECIQKGDFLFVQFGHNDDDTKAGNWMADRMVPLGTPDANGIYPTTEPNSKQAKTYIQEEYDTNTTVYNNKQAQLTEIAKYGDTYYAYKADGSWGTYKGFLKQYIKLARSKGATPVLVTPVARQSFNSDGTLKSGPGLHGEDFAYVKAVRQLAEEENCLLIDLFEETKKFHETATPTYADFLHAFAGATTSDLSGEWPKDYDAAYKNSDLGYNKLDSTHYCKYGAFLCAAKIAEGIWKSTETVGVENNEEYFNFKDNLLKVPSTFIAPPNRISKTMVGKLEDLFPYVTTLDPNLKYPEASEVVSLITEKLGTSVATITAENVDDYKEKVAACRAKYDALNFDDRSGVTNYDILTGYEKALADYADSIRPKPTEIYFYNFNDVTANISSSTTLTVPDSTMTVDGLTPKGGEITLVGKDSTNAIVSVGQKADFTYNNTKYEVTNYLQAGSWTSPRYIEFPVSKPNARVTIVAKSGSASQNRTVNMSKADFNTLHALEVTGTEINLKSVDITETGTYRIGSAGSNIYFYAIIVEYYPAEE